MAAKEVTDSQATAQPPAIGDVVVAKCVCCGLTEECTAAYVARVRQRYGGRWICGLCSEAIKDESNRSEKKIGAAEAFERHMEFYERFKSSTPPADSTESLISAIRDLLQKSVNSPKKQRRSIFPSSSSSSS